MVDETDFPVRLIFTPTTPLMKPLIFVFALTSASLFAQPAAPAPAPAAAPKEFTPEQIKAATDLTSIMGLNRQLESGFNAMMPMIGNLSRQLKLNEADQTELVGLYRSWFTEDIDQAKLKETIIKLYAEMFTLEELTGLTDFYKSPLGQKTLGTLPELTRRSSLAGMEGAKAAQQKLQERLRPFIEKHQPVAPIPGPVPAPEPVK
jgi:hypothetical protein